nr:glycosyltransferase [uncultured Acetatifactor sp.]
MEKAEKGIIFFYGLPAYGHTLSNLYLAGRLAGTGFRVVYYSAEPFRETIEENDCEYRAYPMDWETLDLTDGERILKLYRLVLEYTWKMLPKLLEQAEEERPCVVIFDSLALWGRAVGQLRAVPSFAFYSIAAIDWTWGFPRARGGAGAAVDSVGLSAGFRKCAYEERRDGIAADVSDGSARFRKHCREERDACRYPISPWGKGLGAYAPGFSAGFLRYAGEIPGAAGYAKRLKVRYGLRNLGLLPVLMNRGDYNLCGYSRLFQPGGQGFGREYRFVGPLSVHRKITEQNDFSCWDEDLSMPLIYISLGTVFNQNEEFLQTVVEQLGQRTANRPEDGSFRVVLVWSGAKSRVFPENFTVRPFVNQNEILKHASLFLTAGGMNSIHEALYFGVPCLMCPQQGEQRLNAQRFERLGFGRILRDPQRLRREAWECMKLKERWDEKLRKRMTGVRVGKVLELFEAFD